MSGIKEIARVTRDKRRCGFWVVGSGFDFFAYFTGLPGVDDTYLECDYVTRYNSENSKHMQVRLGASGEVSDDVASSAINKWLADWELAPPP